MKRTAPGLQTLHDAFDYQAATDRDSTACVCRAGDRCLLSYAAVCDRSKVLSKGLASLLGSRPPPTPPLITSVNAAGASTPPAPALVAVQLPRTHPDFVPLLLALSRTGLCFVLLSTDLLEKRLEEDRNALAFRLLQPWLCVRASASSDVSTGCATCLTVTAAQLAHQGTAAEQPSGFSTLSSQPLLCLLFTGGTQRTKIVQVTHAMFLHERVAYKEVWQPRDGQARVLAHTSVYWGASALGQLSIALAYGGCAVWTEATELAELHRCILEERITVLGLVPDLLDMLAPESPARELPGVDLVLTWGERLPRRVAERWRGHPRAVLRELLISTEYWLALFADPLGDAVLHTVSGCDLAVLKDDGNIADLDEVGELCIAGPMVTTGYSVAGDGTAHSDVFRIVGERNFFRTHDLVRLVKGGVLYKGRADMMAKSKGKWVDMFAIEGDLQQLPGVRAARVLADPHSENFHAFVAFDSCVPPAEAIAAARVVLPPQAQLRITPGLPRHPVTRKVNDIRLLESLKWPAPSWPIELAGCSRSADKVATLHVRLREKAQRQLVWTLATFTALLTVADAETLLVQFKLAGLWLIALLGVTRDGTGLRCSFRGVVVTALWALAALAVRPSWSKMRHCLFSVTTFPFVYLALVHADDVRHHGVEKHAAERRRRNSLRASTLLAQYASDSSECSTNDSDNSQYLGHAEVERMLGDLTAHLLMAKGDNNQASCLPTVEDIEFLFNLCDRRCGNNNGKIDEDEILPVCDAWTAYLERASQIAWLLSRFDSDRDGKIDSEDLTALLEELSCGDEVPEEVTRWVLKEADLGGDGLLSAMELARGLCAFYRWRDKDDPRSKMLRVSRLIERDSSLPPPPPRPSGNSGSGVHPLCGGPCGTGGDEDSCIIPRELGAQVTRAAHSASSGSGPGVHGACCNIS